MPRSSHAAAALAALLLAAQPCAAADDFRDSSATPRRTAAFAGAGLTIPLGASGKARPEARLQLSPARLAGSGYGQSRGARGLELGLGPAGKPALYLGGRPTAEIGRRLQLGGGKGTTTLLIVGAVVVGVVLVAAAVAGAQPTPGPPDGAFD